jgi:hypothetical protein
MIRKIDLQSQFITAAFRASRVIEFDPAFTRTGCSHTSDWLLNRIEIIR